MFLQIDHITKSYSDKPVLREVNFELSPHQTLSILGKSGCGKSTLLKIIAGLETQDSGRLFLKSENISHEKPERRNIVYLFQEPLLFPNLNVAENIAFGLRVRKEKEAVVRQKVDELLDSLELTAHRSKMPHQLSGGQKQRVAFGRALIIQPPLLLLDEPFSSLDVEIRTAMQDLYKRMAAQYQLTALFVTHDLKEALIMGNRISYMKDGILKLYDSKEAFVDDSSTGVQKEIAFWKSM